MTYYKRFTDGLTDAGKLIPENSDVHDIIKNTEKDYYLSVYKYTEEQRKLFLESGTVSGLTDVITDKIWWDFDSEHEPEEARQDAIKLVDKLLAKNISPKDVIISYSGNKGFCIELNLEHTLSPKQVKETAFDLANELTHFDTKMYNASRILRILGTKHQKTGLYKIPLTYNQLTTLSMDEIINLAKTIPDYSEEFRWNAINLGIKQKEVDTKEESIFTEELSETIDYSQKPRFLTNCRWSLQQGNFKEGERSTALLCLGSTYKNQGFTKEHVYRMLKATAELQSKRHKIDRFPDEEIYNNIVMQIFGPYWSNGQYTCREKTNWLYSYCSKLDQPCNHKEEDEFKPRTFADLKDDFKHYVKNIDKNTIYTGLTSIDKHVFLSTGANVGLIGAAGCHAKDTEILMHDGSTKKVQDVKVGDLLMGPDSSSREVLKLYRGRQQMVRINPLRNNSFVVNLDHILHLHPSTLKHNKTIPGNLNIKVSNYIEGTSNKKKTKLQGYKLLKTGVEFTKKELKIPPYILGLWLGDGTSSKPEITNMDQEIVSEWTNYANSLNLKVNVQDQKNNRSKVYSLSSKINNGLPNRNLFRNYLKELNLVDNKHIPTSYLLSDRQDRLELLAGLIDTDGYCEANKRGWEISQKRENLANDIVFLARSLGFHASIHKRRKSCKSKGIKVFGDYFIVYISGTKAEEVPTKLARKKVLTPMTSNPNHYGFTYELLEEDNYYGFTIDKDHLYLTSDFFIHHNSGKTAVALEILNHTSKAGVKSVCASLDMAKNRMFEKVLYRITGLPRNELYSIFQNDNEAKVMEQLKVEFGNVNFFKKSSPTVSDIKDYVLKCNEQSDDKIKLVLVDYFERINSDLGDDTAASKKIAGELQDLVDELDVCLITLVQPNKFALSAGPDTPIYDYTKIKGSSFIYQAFRIIISCWRPFYNPSSFSNDRYMQMAVLKNDLGELAEFAFNWNGPRGIITEMEDYQKDEFTDLLKQKQNEKGEDW